MFAGAECSTSCLAKSERRSPRGWWLMTEADWNVCTNPEQMMECVKHKSTPRKMRLFAVAACRLIWHRFTDERSRRAIEIAERYADGEVDDQTLEDMRVTAYEAYTDAKVADGLEPEQDVPPETSGLVSYVACNLIDDEWGDDAAAWAVCAHTHARIFGGHPELCDLFRCVFGNPFRPVSFDPAWRSPTVQKLVESIYPEGPFDRLPILGDALEEAGCNNLEMLNHLRPPKRGRWWPFSKKRSTGHVRGCWVMDLLLNKV